MQEIARRRRRAAGRRPTARLGIIDTQAVKCIPVRGPRGYDAGKQVLGRKRVALVDADGNWLAIGVVPASVQDRDTLPALDAGQAHWPSLREGIYDGAFTAERCEEWSHQHGMRHTVIERPPGQKGFVVLPRRWVVERSCGWLTHWGGLLRARGPAGRRGRPPRLRRRARRIAGTAQPATGSKRRLGLTQTGSQGGHTLSRLLVVLLYKIPHPWCWTIATTTPFGWPSPSPPPNTGSRGASEYR